MSDFKGKLQRLIEAEAADTDAKGWGQMALDLCAGVGGLLPAIGGVGNAANLEGLLLVCHAEVGRVARAHASDLMTELFAKGYIQPTGGPPS